MFLIMKPTLTKRLYKFSIFVLAVLSSVFSAAQQSDMEDALRIFIDCETWCHSTYLKQELTFVHHMRDRQTADVFIQVTSLRTNAGGRRYTLEFYGKERFEGMQDTLTYVVEPNSSEDIQRNLILKNFKKGLLPFLLKTDMVDDLDYNIDITNDTKEEEVNDPWKLWTFHFRGNFNINGQEAYRNTNINSFLGINKVTNEFKFNSGFRYNYDRSFFVIDSSETLTNVITNSSFFATYVKSVSDHFSVGFHSDIQENTFSNFNLSASFQPAVEYNVYPYQEANKKQFTFKYRIGPQYNNYIETTIFDLDSELVFRQSIEMDFTRIEEWGNLYFEMSYGNYLHDLGLWFAFINPHVEFNILRGLSFHTGGSFGWIRNQINIPQADASREDVLLRIRLLKSNYTYGMYFGFSYRFGSRISNIVNVRF